MKLENKLQGLCKTLTAREPLRRFRMVRSECHYVLTQHIVQTLKIP